MQNNISPGLQIKQKAIHGIGWQVVTTVSRTIMNLIFIMVMSRLILKESFGVFAIANVFIAFVVMYAEIGIGSALIQRLKYNEYHLSIAFYFSVFSGLFLYLLIFFLTPLIVSFYDNQFSPNILRYVGLNIIIISFGIVARSLINRNLDFKKLFIIDVISYLVGNLCVGIILAVLKLDIWALILSILVTNAVATFLSFVLKPHSLKIRFHKKEAKEILHYGAGLTLSRTFNYIGNEIDKLLIGKLMNMNYLGLYERGVRVITLPGTYLGGILDRILFPVISKIQDNNEKARFFYLRTISTVCILMTYIGIIFFIYSKEMITILLGEKWLDIVTVFKIFSIVIPLRMITRISDSLIRAKGAVYHSSFIKFIYAVLVIISTLTGVRWGIEGVCVLISISVFITSVMMINLSLKLIQDKWWNFVKILIPAFKFGVILTAKNVLFVFFLKIFGDFNIVNLIIGLSTDLVLIYLIIYYLPTFYGKENLLFIIDIIENSPIRKKLKDRIISVISP